MKMFEVEFDSGYTVIVFGMDKDDAYCNVKKTYTGRVIRVTLVIIT